MSPSRPPLSACSPQSNQYHYQSHPSTPCPHSHSLSYNPDHSLSPSYFSAVPPSLPQPPLAHQPSASNTTKSYLRAPSRPHSSYLLKSIDQPISLRSRRRHWSEHLHPYRPRDFARNKRPDSDQAHTHTHTASPLPRLPPVTQRASLRSDIQRGDYVLGPPPASPRPLRALPPRKRIIRSSSSKPPASLSEEISSNMVLQKHSNYLAAKLDVQINNNGVVDMVGGAQTGTGYSLPGHIIISLPALPSAMEGRLREVRELSITMEGKSEFWDDKGRYTPLRLHTTTLTIATPESPLLLPSHDPIRPYANRIELAVSFDLRVPGWLPPSHSTEMTATAYGVLCNAMLGWTDPAPKSPVLGSVSSTVGADGVSIESIMPFRHTVTKPKSKGSFDSFFSNHSLLPQSTEKSASKWTPFTIQRHRLPTNLAAERHYTLKPQTDSPSPVECVVTVPDWVDVYGDERSLRVALKLRARRGVLVSPEFEAFSSPEDIIPSYAGGARGPAGLPKSVPMQRDVRGVPKRFVNDEPLTQMLELGMEVEEIEKFSSTPSASFTSSFPLPAEQPSHHSSEHQFISPRPVYADGGLMGGYEERPFKGARTRSRLLSDEGTQRSFFFPEGGLSLNDKWRKVNIVLPMPGQSNNKTDTRPQAEMDGPFLRIKHMLKIRVVCRGLGPDAEDTVVILSTPIRFGTSLSSIPSTGPRPAPLPSYSQLFHENGDLKACDPLPLYSDNGLPTIPAPSEPAPTYQSLFSDESEADGVSESFSSRSPSPSPTPSTSAFSSSSEDESMDVDQYSDEDTASSTSSSDRGAVRIPMGRKAIDVPRPPPRATA